MKMFVLRSLLLARFFSAIAAHPQITPPPDLVVRQAANNVCGYYLSEDNTYTLTCPLYGECAIATTTAPAIIFCPTSGIWGDVPVTSVFGYDHWPLGGCTAGQLCCTKSSQTAPSPGTFTFNGGETVLLVCGTADFTYPAFELDSTTLSPEMTPTSTTPVVRTAGSSSRPTASVAPLPASSNSSPNASSSGDTTVEIVLIAVGFPAFVISFAICLFVWLYRESNRRPAKPAADGASQHKEGMSTGQIITWSLGFIVALGSLVVGIIGVVKKTKSN